MRRTKLTEHEPPLVSRPCHRPEVAAPKLVQVPSFSIADLAWRTVFRLGFPLARSWWRLRQPPHQGALVAVHVGPALLLVRSSYRAEWNFPGGGLRPGETPETAARRELTEEIGLAAPALRPGGEADGIWEGRRDHVSFFELRLDRLEGLRLDNREIIAACLVSPDEAAGMNLTAPVRIYLDRIMTAG